MAVQEDPSSFHQKLRYKPILYRSLGAVYEASCSQAGCLVTLGKFILPMV